METNPPIESGVVAGEERSKFKQKLGHLGRRIKRIDMRSPIVAHPFVAVGIAAGVGALFGLARPMPKRGRVAGLLIGALSTIGFRLVREAAITQLAQFATHRRGPQEAQQSAQQGMSAQAPQAGLS